MADHADLAALRASLRENGQQDPIDVAGDVILDGRTRWVLLRELGMMTVQVRDVGIPERDQTHYIVDRALARRHLTAEQKRVLNTLLRETVVEEVTHPGTGETLLIGRGQSERAATLGVTRETVRGWDKEDAPAKNLAGAPTHQRLSTGRIQPIHPAKPTSPIQSRQRLRPEPLRKDRPIPAWSRHFSLFCRRSRPEDREFLLRMAREIHAALRQNHITYEED